MKKKIILIGAGGHSTSCIDVIEKTKKFIIVGLVDKKNKKFVRVGKKKYSVYSEETFLKKKFCKNILIALGSEKLTKKREHLFNKYKRMNFNFPKIISPLSYVSKHSFVDEGTIVMHGAIINANVKIGKNCIINTKSLIEHDCIIGDNSSIATSATINGNVKIEKNCFIGSKAVLVPSIKLKKNSFIKASQLIKK
jgi:sugar O-acyltransferase (sialic acid O-acetyltransferase NeuD family)